MSVIFAELNEGVFFLLTNPLMGDPLANFKLDMSSEKCRHIPLSSDMCPGQISRCHFCHSAGDCHTSGGTSFKAVLSYL